MILYSFIDNKNFCNFWGNTFYTIDIVTLVIVGGVAVLSNRVVNVPPV